MSDRAEEQRRLILDQFTRQAVPFAEMPAHSNEESIRLLIDRAAIDPADTVLDVACGPGLVACPLAAVARHVTGIDLTPAMIEQAKAKQRTTGLTNLTWLVGDAVPLPFPDAAFSVVVTRYSFHHFLEPRAVLAEMVRVCQPGGRVAVIDVFTSSPEQAEAYNRVEKLRDPSHVRALSLGELTGLCQGSGLRDVRTAFYKLDVPLEELTGDYERNVTLWEAATGRQQTCCRGHDRLVLAVAFAPDGKTLASGSGDTTVRLWDAATGEGRSTLRGHTRDVFAVAFAPDSRLLASGGYDGTVRLWDVASGEERAALATTGEEITGLAFAPDGRTLAVAVDQAVQMWDVATGRLVARLEGHQGQVKCLTYSPDGTRLASGGHDRTVRLWDVARYWAARP
jgi:SAM-dependent methyltransferase